MDLAEFRRQMESYRREVDAEAMAMKDTHLALDRLHALYRKFDADERAMANEVLAEWALSPDENLRFDALSLVEEFKIVSAIPALEKLAERLRTSAAPSAPYEMKKVNRMVAILSAT